MMNGMKSENSIIMKIGLCIYLVVCTFIFSCSSNNRDSIIFKAKKVLASKEDISFFDSFSHRNFVIPYIYLDNKRITLLLSDSVTKANKLDQDHIEFEDSINNIISFFDSLMILNLHKAINIMKIHEIDVLNAYKNKLAIGFSEFNYPVKPYLIRGKYEEADNTRSREEMKALFYDKKSQYWIYEISGMWFIQCNK